MHQLSYDTQRRLAAGVAPRHVVEILTSQGLSDSEAIAIVDHEYRAYGKAMKARSVRLIRNGLLWAIGGAVVTVGTFVLIRGNFILAYGAIIWGLYDVVRGVVGLVRFRSA
ncbi:MAG TPA: hypothetical protein VEV38_00425 [Candidatus Eremiobacteraceae bacterium]|nr:hypothetical protein [Candidatus Eremiobacteraceae bacterium]